MRKAKFLAALLLAAAAMPAFPLTALAAAPDAPGVSDPAMAAVLADPRRDKDRARDAFRHPAETLAFFGIRPGMTVVDFIPSGGWYTRILLPYLGEKGQYIGLNPSVVNGTAQQKEWFADAATKFPPKAAAWTGMPVSRVHAYNSDGLPATLKGKVDRVIMMREFHNLWPDGLMYAELATIRGLLKEDGLLGIEEHRAKADAPGSYTLGTMGYMREADVIALVEAHGFRLVGKSEVNANPKDGANWPDGVWTLPPSLALKDKDREKYVAIGESDRMTLLFAKRP